MCVPFVLAPHKRSSISRGPVLAATCFHRASLSTIEAKMRAESWHQLALFSMGPCRMLEANDWPQRGTKRLMDGEPFATDTAL